MRIEVVTVCVGYGDFLAATIAENLPLIDELVVVTTSDDTETHRLPQALSAPRSVRRTPAQRAVQQGPHDPARIRPDRGRDWVLHLDADVVLPRKFRKLVEYAHLDERMIYGADRCNLVGWDKWQRLKQYAGSWDNHAHECGHWFHPELQVGSRWISKFHGYVPIGFFQLFHGTALIDNGYHIRNYPLHHGDAARTDVQFALQWDRRHRQLVPEVIVLHLESESSALGANWKGRTTPRFGPTPLNGSKPHKTCS